MKKETVKIILVGSSASGKTAILLRYIKDNFKLNTPSTIGASYLSKQVETKNKKELTLSVWDTAGQEKYSSISRLVYRKSDAVIIVFDQTNESSFEDVSKRWIKEVQVNAPADTLICLVGNKSDLVDQKRVSSQKGRNLAKRLGCYFYQECSALNGNNVNLIFQKIADKLAERFGGNPEPKKPEDGTTSLEEDILKWQKENQNGGGAVKADGGCCG